MESISSDETTPRMRIALISSSYAPYPGGVEEHTRNVARELVARGHEVVVWTVDRGEGLGDKVVDGIPVHYLATPLPNRSPAGIARFAAAAPRALWSWVAQHRAFRPQVLHVQCFGPNGVYALALHHLTRTPLVVSSHGETFADDHNAFEHSGLLRTGLTRALRSAAAVTGCSQFVLDDLAARFGCTTGVVVPNGVDLMESAGAPTELPYPASTDSPTILGLGRMEHNKGFDLLLQAFAAASLPDHTQLILAGDGGELPNLRTLASDLGVAERVSFPGPLSRPQVVAAFESATVVVVPSRVEAFGIVVLEAWRAGTPLIATTRGGPGELVTQGVNGLLVDPTDTHALAEALRTLTGDAELRRSLGAAGRTTVEGYTWSAVAEQYVKLYGRTEETESRCTAMTMTLIGPRQYGPGRWRNAEPRVASDSLIALGRQV